MRRKEISLMKHTKGPRRRTAAALPAHARTRTKRASAVIHEELHRRPAEEGPGPVTCPVCGRVDEDERKAEEHYRAAHETTGG